MPQIICSLTYFKSPAVLLLVPTSAFLWNNGPSLDSNGGVNTGCCQARFKKIKGNMRSSPLACSFATGENFIKALEGIAAP